MERIKSLDEFYAKQRAVNIEKATHVLKNDDGSIKRYYIIKEVSYGNGLKVDRPQYLSCFGTFDYHSFDRHNEKVILSKLEKI